VTEPVSLRDYFEQRLDALETSMDRRFTERDRAILVHEDMLKDRMLHSNGLIEQMRQQAADYARVGSLEAAEKRIETLERDRSKNEGQFKAAQPLTAIAMLVVAAVVSAVVAVVAARL
jgi:lipopolysaccharide biosynthesis regulator YciM